MKKKILLISTDFSFLNERDDRVGHSIRVSYFSDFFLKNNFSVFILITKQSDHTPEPSSSPIFINNFVIDKNVISVKKLIDFIKEEKINLILTSSPPLMNNNLGFEIKKVMKEKVIWISDVRDHASLHPVLRPKELSPLLSIKIKEAEIAYNADLNLVVSNYAKTYQEALGVALDYPIDSNSIKVIENGALEIKYQNIHDDIKAFINKKDNKISIGYFGTGKIDSLTEKNKNLSHFLQKLVDFKLSNRFKVLIVGKIEVNEVILKKLKRELEILIVPPVSYAMSRSIIRECKVCININTSIEHAPTIIGGKTYDYMVEPVIYLALFPDNAVSLKALQSKFPGKVIFADIYSDKSIHNGLTKIIEMDIKKYSLCYPQFSRNAQCQILLQHIYSLK